MHRGRMTWRKVRVYIERLPPQSATMTAIRRDSPPSSAEREQRDPDAGRWSQLEMLVAALIDEVRRSNFYLLRINGSKTVKAPQPVPRPGVKPEGPRRAVINSKGAARLFELIKG